MERRGASPVMWIIVAALIFLIVAVAVIFGFSGNWWEFSDFIGEGIHGSDRDHCATQVESFCEREGEGADWTERYPECSQFEGDGGVLDSSECNG